MNVDHQIWCAHFITRLGKFLNLFPARQQRHQEGCLVVAVEAWLAGAQPPAEHQIWCRLGRAPARPVLELRHQNCPTTGQFLQQGHRPKSPQTTTPRRPPPPITPVTVPHRALQAKHQRLYGGVGCRCLLVRDSCATAGSIARAPVLRVGRAGNRSGRRLAAAELQCASRNSIMMMMMMRRRRRKRRRVMAEMM